MSTNALEHQAAVDREPLDRTSPMPLYFQLASRIQASIELGEYAVGETLPSELELTRRYEVSRSTARAAVRYLVERGRLIKRRGRDVIVAPEPLQRRIGLTGLFEDLTEAGHHPTTTVLELKEIPCPADERPLLLLEEGDLVWLIERLRFSDGEPIALMRNIADASRFRVTAEDLTVTGLYNTMRPQGIELSAASVVIGARPAEGFEADLLEVPTGSTVLTQRRVTFDDRGRPVEVGHHVYPSSRYSFETTLTQR